MPAVPSPISPDELVEGIGPGANIAVGMANGEPHEIIDALERAAEAGALSNVRVHQMHALRDRGYFDGRYGTDLRLVSYFLSPSTRGHAARGEVDVVPAHFSEVPLFLGHLERLVVFAACSTPDRHGHVSLGTNAEYIAPLLGRVPVYLEANAQMPRTSGRNTIHLSQVTAWCESDYPLAEAHPAVPDARDLAIAEFVAERIEDGACLQAGIGSVPNSVLALLKDRRNLGVHTELLTDGFVDLVEAGAVTGLNKVRTPGQIVGTFALGTNRLYDFMDDNPAITMLPVDWVNNPRVIAQQPKFVSVNGTVEVDFLGQAASEMIGGHLWSGSGGQADFARGALFSPGGQGFLVLPSTTSDGTISRIVPRLGAGQAVTTLKNTVDRIVTEYGVAELRGRSIRERTHALVAIAHPAHREELEREARAMGWW
ncbi:MAG: acetyl-CoA hydrolase/transferase family protein [Actinobacteria bacterium]|nr:acetyl-CoA hydrolase/transferase family protein [Actinomycetota bacterium]